MLAVVLLLLLLDEPPPPPLGSSEAYPSSAISKGEQGTTEVDLLISADGKVGGCRLLTSSGSDALDFRTCELLRERARFKPARDAQGNPVPTTHRQKIRWQLEDESEAAKPDQK